MSEERSTFQQRVAEFVREYGLETSIQARALDLTSEIGELTKEVLKGTKYGRWQFEPSQGWEDELGDVFFALVCLANSTGVDLEVALDRALHKYQNRLEDSSEAGSGR